LQTVVEDSTSVSSLLEVTENCFEDTVESILVLEVVSELVLVVVVISELEFDTGCNPLQNY